MVWWFICLVVSVVLLFSVGVSLVDEFRMIRIQLEDIRSRLSFIHMNLEKNKEDEI